MTDNNTTGSETAATTATTPKTKKTPAAKAKKTTPSTGATSSKSSASPKKTAAKKSGTKTQKPPLTGGEASPAAKQSSSTESTEKKQQKKTTPSKPKTKAPAVDKKTSALPLDEVAQTKTGTTQAKKSSAAKSSSPKKSGSVKKPAKKSTSLPTENVSRTGAGEKQTAPLDAGTQALEHPSPAFESSSAQLPFGLSMLSSVQAQGQTPSQVMVEPSDQTTIQTGSAGEAKNTEAVEQKATSPKGKKVSPASKKSSGAKSKNGSASSATLTVDHGGMTEGVTTEGVPAVESASTAETITEGSPGSIAEVQTEAGVQKAPAKRSRSSRGRRGNRDAKKAVTQEDSEAMQALVDDELPLSDGEDQYSENDDTASKKQDKKEQQQSKLPRRKMFVSVHPEEQVEVVITEEGQVQEYYVEMLQQQKTKGNIYKATIHNLDPNLQAAFVNYGANKNGFLQIDEVHPEYFNAAHEPSKGRKYPPIQKVLKNGQELLVQVVKEPTGNKGAFLTTYLSMPGRFLVLTPGREQIGVSRKVDNDEERSRLRDLLEGLTPGPGLGVIVRTVSMGASKANLQKDLQNLKRVWKEVRKRGTQETPPCLIYQEMDLTTRAVRDYLTDQVCEVWIDDEQTASAVEELAKLHFPQKKKLVNLHKDHGSTLFERFNLQRQLDQIQSREVVLPSGGRLVIDPTEALTAIDINSGRSGGKNTFEDMAFRTNMEAARMIPLQLRLRDIGGQIVADFIEMRDKNHWREVERTLRQGMKVDRARYDIGKIGPFGMLEMVRQRLGSSAISVSMEVCPHCRGTGIRRNMEWQSQQAMREIMRKMKAAQSQKLTELVFETDQPVAMHLLNSKRQRICEMEQQTGVRLEIIVK